METERGKSEIKRQTVERGGGKMKEGERDHCRGDREEW